MEATSALSAFERDYGSDGAENDTECDEQRYEIEYVDLAMVWKLW